MPTLVEALYIPARTDPPRKKWTRGEIAAFAPREFWERQHVELIWGELIDKMSKGKLHSIVIAAVFVWLLDVFGKRYVYQEISIDVMPEDIPTNEPEPDVVVLTRPLTEIPSANARPLDIRLAVEISDTTFTFDSTTKAELYARAGIAEYWIFDIQKRRLLVHRVPRDGRYISVTTHVEQESVSPLAAPDKEIRVAVAFEGLQ
jgi:Uma2 family endonuclease